MLLPILEPGINKKYKKIQKNQKILEENIYIYTRYSNYYTYSEKSTKKWEEYNTMLKKLSKNG